MNKVEKKLSALIGNSWQGATPGLVIQVHERGRKRADLRIGETYPYYDWASLTKIVFSVTQLMTMVDEKRLRLDEPVKRALDWFRAPAPEARCRVRDLLTHSAGLTWWQPFYKSIDRNLPRPERWMQLEGLVGKEMKASARKKGAYTGKAVYSDLDFFTLGALMRRRTDLEFEQMWARIADRLGLEEAGFHVGNRPPKARKLYAPTERCAWRGKLIQGEVHDENTWALGGVGPHAGLFGPLEDLSRWGLCLRRGILDLGGKGLAKPETVRRFARRALPRELGDWGLGFMMPSRPSASCGKYFSLRSVGHLGFTGTSLWFDPKRDLLVTILSNRVHPTRDNKLFPQLRPSLHNWVVESLGS